jgi:hypothetical protein
MRLESFATARLFALGCERLPKSVKEQFCSDFEEKAIKALSRLAERNITAPTVARAFLNQTEKKKGVGADGLNAATRDETIGIAGTNPLLSNCSLNE